MPCVLHTKSVSPQHLQSILREIDAANFLGVEAKKLRRLVYEKRGPRTIKLGRERLYPRDAFLAWVAERES